MSLPELAASRLWVGSLRRRPVRPQPTPRCLVALVPGLMREQPAGLPVSKLQPESGQNWVPEQNFVQRPWEQLAFGPVPEVALATQQNFVRQPRPQPASGSLPEVGPAAQQSFVQEPWAQPVSGRPPEVGRARQQNSVEQSWVQLAFGRPPAEA
jgi:hypothetical protein